MHVAYSHRVLPYMAHVLVNSQSLSNSQHFSGAATGKPEAWVSRGKDNRAFRVRLCTQTHQFFLERDPSGSWHWYWWLKVPGQAAPGQAASGQGQPAAQSSPGQVGTQEQSPSTRHIDSNATQPPSLSQPSGARPSSRGVWSAVTQVAFGESPHPTAPIRRNVKDV